MKLEAKDSPGAQVSDWLEWGRKRLTGFAPDEARQEGERILETLLGVSRAELYLSPEKNPRLFPKFSEWIQARQEGIPLAYLSGQAPFWDAVLEIEEGVLIPRPETEVLIESFLNSMLFSRETAFNFLDLGTGSGNIAITLASLFPRAWGMASDISEKALALARRNAEDQGVDPRLHFVRADGIQAFRKEAFEVIFSNPPYVASEEWPFLEKEVRREPRLALDGGADGLSFYRRILGELDGLKKGGSLWVEIGWNQSRRVRELFKTCSFSQVRTFRDLNSIERVVAGIGFQNGGHG